MSHTVKKSKRKRSPNLELKCAIIQEVRKRPPLWDECDENWNNADVYCQLWDEVGEIFCCTGATVRNKWIHLKDRYNCEVLKELEGYRSNCVYKSKWPFYRALKFLDSTYEQGMGSPRANGEQRADCIIDLCDLCQNYLESEAGPSQKMMFPQVCNNRNYLHPESDPQSIKVYAQPKSSRMRTSIPEICQDPDQQINLPLTKGSSRSNQIIEKVDACDDACTLYPNFEDKCDEDQIIKVQHGKTGKYAGPKTQVPAERIIKHIESPKANMKEKCAISLGLSEDVLKKNPNYQFLMSLLPYLDQLDQTECLEARSQIQCMINEAYKRRKIPCSYYNSQY